MPCRLCWVEAGGAAGQWSLLASGTRSRHAKLVRLQCTLRAAEAWASSLPPTGAAPARGPISPSRPGEGAPELHSAPLPSAVLPVLLPVLLPSHPPRCGVGSQDLAPIFPLPGAQHPAHSELRAGEGTSQKTTSIICDSTSWVLPARLHRQPSTPHAPSSAGAPLPAGSPGEGGCAAAPAQPRLLGRESRSGISCELVRAKLWQAKRGHRAHTKQNIFLQTNCKAQWKQQL